MYHTHTHHTHTHLHVCSCVCLCIITVSRYEFNLHQTRAAALRTKYGDAWPSTSLTSLWYRNQASAAVQPKNTSTKYCNRAATTPQRGATVVTWPATMKRMYRPIREQLRLISSCPWTPELCSEEWSFLHCRGFNTEFSGSFDWLVEFMIIRSFSWWNWLEVKNHELIYWNYSISSFHTITLWLPEPTSMSAKGMLIGQCKSTGWHHCHCSRRNDDDVMCSWPMAMAGVLWIHDYCSYSLYKIICVNNFTQDRMMTSLSLQWRWRSHLAVLFLIVTHFLCSLGSWVCDHGD